VGVALDPQGAAAGAVGTATGMPAVAGTYTVLAWPWIAAAAGVWMALAGVVLFVAGRGWKGSRKYAPAPAASGTAASSNTGPSGTAASGTAGPDAGSPTKSAGQAPDSERLDEIDGWDSLSRGEDPTS
jgi:hypothetical protein